MISSLWVLFMCLPCAFLLHVSFLCVFFILASVFVCFLFYFENLCLMSVYSVLLPLYHYVRLAQDVSPQVFPIRSLLFCVFKSSVSLCSLSGRLLSSCQVMLTESCFRWHRMLMHGLFQSCFCMFLISFIFLSLDLIFIVSFSLVSSLFCLALVCYFFLSA